MSPHHLHCPKELLAKARGENLFRDENATVRGLPSAQARQFASLGRLACPAGFRAGGWDVEWMWKRALSCQCHELKEEL
jgi:hypothetical protein